MPGVKIFCSSFGLLLYLSPQICSRRWGLQAHEAAGNCVPAYTPGRRQGVLTLKRVAVFDHHAEQCGLLNIVPLRQPMVEARDAGWTVKRLPEIGAVCPVCSPSLAE